MTKKQRGRPKTGHVKETMMGVRIYPEDRDIIKKLFGSNQKFLDVILKRFRGDLRECPFSHTTEENNSSGYCCEFWEKYCD